MRITDVLAQFREELRSHSGEGEVLEPMPHVTRRSYLGGLVNGVTAFDIDASSAIEVIRGEVSHYQRLGREFEWKVFSFDQPPDLLDRMQAEGFEVGDREALVVYDLAEGLGPFEIQSHCEVRRIERVDQLDDYRSLAETIFQKDYSRTVGELTEALERRQGGHDAYVGYLHRVPASVGRMYTHPKSAFAGLYGGGTLPEYRSRGVYRAVTAARARDAAAKGVRYLQVDALPTSLPILLLLGFVHVADTWPCTLPS